MSELSDKALSAIQDSVKVEILTDKAGNEFSTRVIHPVHCPKFIDKTPSPTALTVSTLTGFVDFCKTEKFDETEIGNPAMIHVVNEGQVLLLSEIFGDEKKRDCFLIASFGPLLGSSFNFGQYYDQEQFIVGLMSLFEPTPIRAEVLKVIGTIKENQVREFSDDGVSQSVSAKAGIALVSEIPVPSPVTLRPYRTFREIAQPESLFILRVRKGKDERPQCALFEADGGRWKLTAIQSIKEYLEDLVELPIIA